MFFSGIGLIIVSAALAVLCCKLGKRKKEAEQGLLENMDDDD